MAQSWNGMTFCSAYSNSLFDSDPQLKVTPASARTYLSNTTPLVLIDNLQLSEEAFDELADMFPQAPILAASGATPDIEAFEPFTVGVLKLPEAIELLAKKARINLEGAERDFAAGICNLLCCMPLAIATVGNVMRDNGLTGEKTLSALQAIQTTATQPEKVAIEKSLQFANSTLSEDERQLMAMTAAAPAISASREWLANAGGGNPAIEKLENLRLLQANSPRLRLHSEYAALILNSELTDSIRGQLLITLVEALKDRSLDFEFVKDELGNILGILKWAADQQRWADVVALGRAVDAYLTLHGLWGAWRNLLDQVLMAGRSLGDKATQAWALHQLGTRFIGIGDLQAAKGHLNEALELRTALGDQEGKAFTQHNLDYLGTFGGDQPPNPSSPPNAHELGAWWKAIHGKNSLLGNPADFIVPGRYGRCPGRFDPFRENRAPHRTGLQCNPKDNASFLCNLYANLNRFPNPECYAYYYIYTHSHFHPNRYANADRDRNKYTNSHANQNARPDEHAYTNHNPYPNRDRICPPASSGGG